MIVQVRMLKALFRLQGGIVQIDWFGRFDRVPAYFHPLSLSTSSFHYWNKKLKHTEDEQIAYQIVMNDHLYLSGEMVIVHLPNGLRAELPTSLSSAQIQTWLKAL